MINKRAVCHAWPSGHSQNTSRLPGTRVLMAAEGALDVIALQKHKVETMPLSQKELQAIASSRILILALGIGGVALGLMGGLAMGTQAVS